MRRSLVALVLMSSALWAGAPTDNPFERVETTVVTPHLPLGRPAVGGTVRLLVIAPAWGQRESVELAQRFDVAPAVLMTCTHTAFSGEAPYLAPDKVAARLDAALAARPEVIVIGGFDWRNLLLEHRAGILERVHQGAGLVYVAPPANDELAQLWARQPLGVPESVVSGVPLARLTAFRGRRPADLVQAGRFGQGRWLRLNYATNSTSQSLTPALWPWPADWEYEYCQSLLGKAIRWAAGREPAQSLAVQAADGVLTGPAGARLDGWVQRLADGTVQPLQTAGERLRVPTVPTGDYLATVRHRTDSGQVVDWCTVPVVVDRGLDITALAPSKLTYAAGEAIDCQLRLSRAPRAGEQVAVGLQDRLGRLLARAAAGPGAESALRLPGQQPLAGCLHQVVATVTGPDGILATRSAPVSIRGRARPAFHLAIWEEPEVDHISRLWYHRYRELGVDAIFYSAGRGTRDAAALAMAEAGLWAAPSVPMYNPRVEAGPLGPVAQTSLHDPAWQQSAQAAALKSAAPFAPYDVLFYPTGSDVSMHGNSFDPATLAAFRQWLAPRYADVAALNQAWGTQFGSFAQVVPEHFAQAKQSGRFAGWVEHTRFMEESFAEHHRRLLTALQTVDPEPLLGEDGYGRLDSVEGSDWWRLLATSGFYNLYTYQDPAQLQITRSLARAFANVKLRSLYYGSYDGQFGNARFLRQIPWYAALHDYNGLFWWIANGKATYAGTVNAMVGPDFQTTRSFELNRPEIEAVRDGVIQMLDGAPRPHDGIALLYDQTAIHAVTAYSHPSVVANAMLGWQQALEDLGRQYDTLAAAQVAGGALTRGGYRVLVLCQALALDAPTAAAIRQFQAAGGQVLADTAPARYDELLRPVAEGRRLAGVTLCDGKFGEYPQRRTAAAGQAVRQTLARLLAPSGTPPAVQVSGAAADAPGVPNLETVVYDLRPGRLVGLLNNAPARPIEVTLPAPAHVYDARARRYLGHVSHWSASLADGETQLYALLPARLDGLAVSSTGATVTAELRRAGDGPCARQAVRFTVSDPRGGHRPEYDGIALTKADGRATWAVPFALSDVAGNWTITATDLIGGERAQAAVRRTQP